MALPEWRINTLHDPHSGQFAKKVGGAPKLAWHADAPEGTDSSLKVQATLDRLASRYTVKPTDVRLESLDLNWLGQTKNRTNEIELNRGYWGQGYADSLRKAALDSAKPTSLVIGWDFAENHNRVELVPWKTYDQPEDTITHEYGHVLFNKLERDSPNSADSLLALMSDESGTNVPVGSGADYKASVDRRVAFAKEYGAYGLTSPKEALGIAFVAYEAGKTTGAAQLVGQAFERYRTPESKRSNPYHGVDGKFTSAPGGNGSASGLMAVSSTEISALETKARNGGFTYSTAMHNSPTSGFAFSPYPKRSRVIDTKSMTSADVQQYINDNQDVLKKKGHYLGAWREQSGDVDRVWLDVSVVADTQAEAATVGKQFNQIAAWDLAAGKEVALGGTGRSRGGDVADKLTRFVVPIDGLDVDAFVEKVKGDQPEREDGTLPAWRAKPNRWPKGAPAGKGGEFAPKAGAGGGGKGGGGGAATGAGEKSWSAVVPKGIDPALQPVCKKQMDKLAADWVVPMRLKTIDPKPGDLNFHTIAGDNNYYGAAGVPSTAQTGSDVVPVNKKYWAKKETLRGELSVRTKERTKQAGEFPGAEPLSATITGPWVTGDKPEDVLNHEYGEVLFGQLQRDDPTAARKLLDDVSEMSGGKRLKGTSARMYDLKTLQGFAKQHGFMAVAQPKEAVGEAFAEAQRGESNELTALVAKAFARYQKGSKA